MLYLTTIFLFWNADQHLDIVIPLMMAKGPIKELYKIKGVNNE